MSIHALCAVLLTLRGHPLSAFILYYLVGIFIKLARHNMILVYTDEEGNKTRLLQMSVLFLSVMAWHV